MSVSEIPPNDPQRPRWLLDLEQWEVHPYSEIPQQILEEEGYGIVSYTWGYIADFDNLAVDLPKGVFWDVPTTTKWSLFKAREVMKTMGKRYMWWDWMCVPQGGRGRARPLTPELKEAQGQEIGKQLHIYRGAKGSIVWLHSTCWKDDSALKSLLLLPHPHELKGNLEQVQEFLEHAQQCLSAAQDSEYWLRSGWTLQEGVLLGNTHLVDVDGATFSTDRYYQANKIASVDDIGTAIDVLAHHLFETYFLHVEGYDPYPSRPLSKLFADLLPNTPETNMWLRRRVKSLSETGLVGFSRLSPLSILAGKQSRRFGVLQDSCWALVGALELENIEVSYDLDMEEIKARLLVALVEKYQWMMLEFPYPDFDIQDKTGTRRFKWTDISDGAVLPIHLSTESAVDPEVVETTVPRLSFSDTLTIKAAQGKKIILLRPLVENVVYFRHYRQDGDGVQIVSPKVMAFEEYSILRDAWFTPQYLVDEKDKVLGRRCVVVSKCVGQSTNARPVRGVFGGIVDLWCLEPERMEVDEVILDSS